MNGGRQAKKIRKLQAKVRDLQRRLDELENYEHRVRRLELACQAAGAAMLTPVLVAEEEAADAR
jgi:hypothetical protein